MVKQTLCLKIFRNAWCFDISSQILHSSLFSFSAELAALYKCYSEITNNSFHIGYHWSVEGVTSSSWLGSVAQVLYARSIRGFCTWRASQHQGDFSVLTLAFRRWLFLILLFVSLPFTKKFGGKEPEEGRLSVLSLFHLMSIASPLPETITSSNRVFKIPFYT